MKKKLFATVAALMLAVSMALTGCGPSQEEIDRAAQEEAQAQAQAESEAKIQSVADSIDAIGEVTLDSGKAIAVARKAYNELNADQKEAVSNYAVLEAAETTYAELEAASKAFAVGDTVSDADFSVTLTEATIASTLESSESSTYWEAGDGATFVILEFDIEALNSNEISVDSGAVSNVVGTFNGNTYKGWDYKYVVSQLWLPGKNRYFEANMPVHMYVYTSLPGAAEGSGVTVNMDVAGQSKVLTL